MAQTKKFQKEFNSGTSSLVLLSVLSRSKEAMYGYQIAKLLEENGPEIPMMKQGTLYPMLRSLEENGLLENMVEPHKKS
ncbi:MAG: helix-turn-helix transcriptional regulator [Chloroflexi bacterium]|nr:helix-turn-helix transcriptional regulator [Chloroflexota bacterium]